MKIVFVLLFFVSQVVFAEGEPQVRVRVVDGASSISLKGFSVVLGGLSDLNLSSQTSEILRTHRLNIDLSFENNKATWSVVGLGKEETQIFSGDTLQIHGDFLEINGKIHVPSNIQLIARSNDKFDVIAHLPMEDYLVGVLPAEMPASWPIEAIKAQAVASRSYTMSLLKERSHLHFDVEATVNDQVFDLSKQIGAQDRFKRKVTDAIDQTQGLLLSFGDGKYYRAYYHADSGGQTELAKYVWGGSTNGQPSASVLSPFPKSPHGLWEKTYERSVVENTLQKYFSIHERVKSLKVNKTSPSGRVQNLLVEFTKTNKVISAQNFRRLFGFMKIKSTNFNITKKDEKLIFQGKGFGHGVGMCQWGARHLAQRGLSYSEILEHYYPKTILSRVYEGSKKPVSKVSSLDF